MPDDELKSLIQSMIDGGESEEDIAATVKRYSETRTPEAIRAKEQATWKNPTNKSTAWEPDTFLGGVLKANLSGDVLKAEGNSLGGYIQGAVGDIPSSIWGLGELGYGMLTDPRKTISNTWEGIKGIPSHVAETTKMAGSDPWAFGRMMGQYTGQPAVTEGAIKVAPKIPGAARAVVKAAKPIVRATGGPIEAAGNTALMSAPFVPYGYKMATAGAGAGLRKIGQYLGRVGEADPEAMAADIEKFTGPATPKVPPTKATVHPYKADIWDDMLEEARPITDEEAIDHFLGPETPPVKPTKTVINEYKPDIWDDMLAEERPITNEEAIDHFLGPETPKVQPTKTVIQPNKPDIWSEMLKEEAAARIAENPELAPTNPIKELQAKTQLDKIGKEAPVKQLTLEDAQKLTPQQAQALVEKAMKKSAGLKAKLKKSSVFKNFTDK